MKEDEILTDLLGKIGKRLEELRMEAGYKSYESFAFDNELNRVQYWRMEKGKTNLTMASLVKVLLIHKLSIPEFFSSLLSESRNRRKPK